MPLTTQLSTLPDLQALGATHWPELPVHTVEQRLGTSTSGLTQQQAHERLRRFGPNELQTARPISNLKILLHQVQSPIIYILLGALVITLALGHWVDASVIGVVLLVNTVLGFVQERRAEESVQALLKLLVPRAHVIRDGRERELGSRELVPGDLVLLESGVRVAADLRLATALSLAVDESLLTGESVPAEKQTNPIPAASALGDRSNMVFAGSTVARGRARGYVTATGANTVLGGIAESIRREPSTETPLQLRMKRFANVITVAVVIASAAVFAIGTAVGLSAGEMFLVVVGLGVAAVPEGLPIVLTIALAVGVRRMARNQAIIRRLAAVETLGSTTVIGSDKTGTLTENRMKVQEIWAGGESYDLGQPQEDLTGAVLRNPALELTVLAAVLANEADIYLAGNDVEHHGDPTETALLVASHRVGMNHAEVRHKYPGTVDIPFESERQYSASSRHHEGEHKVFIKGAPERVLSMCHRMMSAGDIVPLQQTDVLAAARSMAAKGLRVLGMAYASTTDDGRTASSAGKDPQKATFVGLMGMMDPPRPGVKEAIARCQSAGMRVVMITGDHAATAEAIGSELGIHRRGDQVLNGVELEALSDESLIHEAGRTTIYARVAPEQKLRVVRALQQRGEVVAVTGDGVNDAPALKAAEIGIAMGIRGTDVAREAADMVLADDNFLSIAHAVEQGRITFDNLRKVTFFLISTGVAAILTMLVALALRWPLPLLPAQLLWLNLVTNGLQDIALAFEPGEKGVLDRPPRPVDEGILSGLLWERTVFSGLVMAVGTLFLFRWELAQTGSLVSAQTVALTTMVIFQFFHLGNARSDRLSLFRINPFSNRFLFLASGAALLIHAGALYFSPTQFVLRVEPVALDAWIRMALVASSILMVVELHKVLRSRDTAPHRVAAYGLRQSVDSDCAALAAVVVVANGSRHGAV
ncbi:MAG: cation-translocating P-type ATPase, partial [Candidatus Korobacteraceae bacterium]